MSAQGDVVFMIGADASGLMEAGHAGEKSLAQMERAAKELERSIGKLGQAGVAYQRELNGLTGVTREFSKSARDSASAFDAWDKSRAQVDNLRASIDPLFAASKRYEAALVQLDGALEAGTISAREHASMVDLLSQSYLRADKAQAAVATGGTGLVGAMQRSGGAIQQVGYQVQDIAVQLAGGQSAFVVFAQQGSQIASIFGPMGVMLGTLAAVALPLLGAAFANAGAQAKTFDESMQDLEASVRRVSDVASVYSVAGLKTLQEQYGAVTEGVLSLVEAQRVLAESQAMSDAIAVAKALRTEYETGIFSLEYGYERLAGEIGTTNSQASQLLITLGEMGRSSTLDDAATYAARLRQEFEAYVDTAGPMTEAQRVMYQQIVDMEAAMRRLTVSAPAADWMSGAIASVQSLGVSLWDAVKAKAALSGEAAGPGMTTGSGAWAQNGLGFNLPGQELLPGGGTAGGAASGGGGGSDPITAEIERLQQSLMTEEQLEMESYAKRQAMLQQALEQRVVTQEDYAKLMENAQAQHQERMSGIDVYRYGTGLQQAEAFMGGMANALQGGNEQMQKISRAFGAAEALINAWRAFTQTMADPTLPFFAKFGAAASVLSAGMGAVNAIKSGSKTSGAATGGAARATAAMISSSSAGGGSAAAAAPDQSQIVNISLTGDSIGRDGMAGLFDQINKGLAKGYRIERVNFT